MTNRESISRRGGPRDEAVSAILGLIVAGLLLTAAFSYALVSSLNAANDVDDPAHQTDIATAADHVADLILRTPGTGWSGTCADDPLAAGLDWQTANGETSSRFGLGDGGCSVDGANLLDFSKLMNIQEALMSADGANGLADYEEVRRSLGLDEEDLDFHIRSEPVLASVREVLKTGAQDPYVRPLYVGNYELVPPGQPDPNETVVRLVQHVSGITDGEEFATLYTEIENNGTTPTVFEVQFKVHLVDGDIYITRHTPVLAPGDTHNATARLWKTKDWSWGASQGGTGSIRVCTVLTDENGTITDGTEYTDVQFTAYSVKAPPGYPAAGSIGYTVHTAPFTLNADTINDDGVLDAYCTTYSNLPLGGYFYGQSQIPAGQGWAPPKYNDQHNNAVNNYDDFLEYSGELFDADPDNDDARDTDSDGHIVLNSGRPNRTLLIMHQFVGGEGGYTGPAYPDILHPTSIEYVINDVEGQLTDGLIQIGEIDMTAPQDRRQVFVNADNLAYLAQGDGSGQATLEYAAYKGDGTLVAFDDWQIELYNPDGSPNQAPIELAATESGTQMVQFAAVGSYEARIMDDAGTKMWNDEMVNIVALPLDGFRPDGPAQYQPAPSVAIEAAFLDALTESFSPFVFDSKFDHPAVPYAAGGDVYPDLKQELNVELPQVLSDGGVADLGEYNVLVIGSDVDHQAMTSGAAKQIIKDWVNGGGVLIVFGSGQQNVQWLAPLFESSIDAAGEGLTAIDTTHPVLNVPNRLVPQGYQAWGVWGFGAADASHFSHVVVNEAGDLLSVSNPGDFGKGRVILTSYRPFDLTSEADLECGVGDLTSECQAIQMIQNMVSMAYRGLYIDYGPSIPADEPHGTAVRVVQVDHPELQRRVAMKVYFYVF